MTTPPPPIAHLRACSAADALLAARARLAEARRVDRAAAEFVAEQVLQADDELARADGMVGQGDGVSWRQLDALFDLAMFGGHVHRGLVHPSMHARNDCVWCDRAEQFRHVAVVDVIAGRRRTTATDLDLQARRAAEASAGTASWPRPRC